MGVFVGKDGTGAFLFSKSAPACESLWEETAPARTPTRPPIQYDPVGGRVGVRAGADSSKQKRAGRCRLTKQKTTPSSVEYHRALAIEQDAVLEVPGDGSGEDSAFDVAALADEVVG